ADPQKYLTDIKALTAPKMEGRGDGTRGLTRAEQMIATRYKSLGLQPAGSKGYLQAFPVAIGKRLRGGNRLFEEREAGGNALTSRMLKVSEDYVPVSFSASGNVHALVVFAGYGITAPESSYDDYQGLDVKEKIVLVLRNEPPSFSAKTVQGGKSRHAELVTK